jgi:hypothetical protein
MSKGIEILLLFILRREERGRFIRLKYTDRKFVKEEEEDVDPEVELACLKQTESDDEKLLEESEEV